MIELRPYQRRAVADLYKLITGGCRRSLFILPTGGGKTICAGVIMRDAVARGRRVLFLAHRIELVDQAKKKLVEMGISGVTVATAQGLLENTAILPHASVIVVDEAHTQHASKVVDLYEADSPLVIGLTATPLRNAGRPLGGDYDGMTVGATYSDLVREGAILTPTIWAPHIPEMGATRSDYSVNAMLEEMSRPAVIGNVVQTWRDHAAGEPSIVFAVNRAHAELLLSEFQEAGVAAEIILGTTPARVREDAVHRFRAGLVPVLVSVGVLTEGFDAPECRNIVLARPTASLALYLQMVGRGCRPAPGKSTYRIFDHASCVVTHGFPHHDREWSLTKKPRPPDAIRVGLRVCDNFHVYDSGNVCPVCGIVAGSDARKIRMLDGRLVQVEDMHPSQVDLVERANARKKFRQHLYIKAKAVGMHGAQAATWVEKRLKEFDAREV